MNFKLIKETVKYVRQQNPAVEFVLTTNLTLMTKEIADFFVKNNFHVGVSLDGPAFIHDKYRITKNNEKTHDVILKNLEIIKSIDQNYFFNKITFMCVLAPHEYNLNSLDEYFSNEPPFRDFSLARFKINVVNSEINTFEKDNNYSEFYKRFNTFAFEKFINAHIHKKTDFSDMKATYICCVDGFKRILYRNPIKMDEFSYFWPNGACIPGLRSLYVSSDGNLYPCESLYDHNTFSIGDVESGINIQKIANLVEEYCKETVDYCKDCWAYRFCGSCFTSALIENGKYSHEKKKANCESRKSGILQSFKDFLTVIDKNPTAFDYLTLEDKPVNFANMNSDD